ncbi:hypothetical protein DIPPA_28112 [Diplonema papillatum]|nr:hypothetical protein DIPPA_28112 [Diplonema papillatum]
MEPPPAPKGRKRKRASGPRPVDEAERVLPEGDDEPLLSGEPWRFHLQVASYRLMPVTVRALRGIQREGVPAKAVLDDSDRKTVVLMLKKYLQHRVERIWCLTTSARRPAAEEVAGKMRKSTASQATQGPGITFDPPPKGKPASSDAGYDTYHLRIVFRPVTACTVLQPHLNSVPTSSFPLKRYSTTPNELVVEVEVQAHSA